MTDQTPRTEADDLRNWLEWAAARQLGVPNSSIVDRIQAEAAAQARTEALDAASYVRGHWDGLHCDADSGFGILDECEHVGRIYEPDATQARTEGLYVEVLARGVWTWRYGDREWHDGGEDERDSTYIAEHIAREYRAILAGETE